MSIWAINIQKNILASKPDSWNSRKPYASLKNKTT